MSISKVVATFQALLESTGLPGNLLLIATIVLEKRFHVMRYVLLASLAVSDFLWLALVNTFRTASILEERWLFGETMCYLNPCLSRYLHINTVLHLVVVSYDRYQAIVRSPLTYSGAVTCNRVALIVLIWIIPIPLSIGPFLDWGKYVYNPEVFYCEQGWSEQSASSRWNMLFFSISTFVGPFLVIILLNQSVYKTAKRQINASNIQQYSSDTKRQQQEMSRRVRERKAATDVSIIIAAFLLCFLPAWIVGTCRQFAGGMDIPSDVVLVTACIFSFSTLCNPIIYSIRKNDFRAGAKNVLRRFTVCATKNNNNTKV